MRHPVRCFWLLLTLFCSLSSGWADDLDLPPESIEGGSPGRMMQRYLREHIQQAAVPWEAAYETRKTPEEIAAYQKRLRERFLSAIGGLPERTPLEPQVVGVVNRPGYRVEKILFQSQPKHYVTGLLFLPDPERFKPPYPGVLEPCGHALPAKGHPEYQTLGALLALNGMVALVYDPIDQGERGQYLGKDGWPNLWGVSAHTMVGLSSILLGQNAARFEIWDGMRAIDYLQSRPEVDPQRIGCTGNSGGGTQTAYLMALDDRIRAASPSCSISYRMKRGAGGGDCEQNIFGQLAFGMDNADLIMMRAPLPVLICGATHDFFNIEGAWETFRFAKRLYTRLGWAERVDILENDAGHNFDRLPREGIARWMSRWLLGNDQPIAEPEITLLSQQEYQCVSDGKVMALPGARSVYDLNEDTENELAKRRAAAWATGDRAALLDGVRRLAGIRTLAELPQPTVETLGTVERPGYRIERLAIKPEPGITLPALLMLPAKPDSRRIVLYFHQQGKSADAGPGGPIEQRVKAGETVLAVDLRGRGQTQAIVEEWAKWAPSDYMDFVLLYLLGRSYVGMWAEDILVCNRYVVERLAGNQSERTQLVAIGDVGIAALHAAALEPASFQSVSIHKTLACWANVVHSRLHKGVPASVVHGALVHYDLPDLVRILGDKITVHEPVDALGNVISTP